MAAFASLVCLSNLMVQIQNHPRFSTFFDKNQILFLAQHVEFLLDFVERYNSHGGTTKEEVQDLEKQIASAAYAAVNLTENYLEDQIIAGSKSEQKRLAYLLDLHKLMVDMDFIKEKVVEVKQKKQPANPVISAPPKPLTSGKPTMVGFDDELIQLMDLLTRKPSGRTIIPIVGMGGIGKTTLARNAFEHLLIKQNFDLCLWATISQVYSITEILLQLLSFTQRKFTCERVHELGEHLYKSLCGRRYFVVLDDMWNIEVWDKIKVFFPNNGERSGFTITTRVSKVAAHFNSCCIMMKFLDEDKSWKLLCEKAFGEEDCPDELEETGKEIVKKCKGLPLSIVVIGGHLRKSSMSIGYWLDVANDINSVLDSGEDAQCLSILSLSYTHLPVYLKPCFLYIGTFFKDKKIRVSKLVKLWVAEGFLKQSETQSFEEVAEIYLNDLVDRNLILVHERTWNGRIKFCNIHDLLRDLCIVVAEKERFHHSSKIQLLKTTTMMDEHGVVYTGSECQQGCLRYLNSKIYLTMSYYSRPISHLFLHSTVFLHWNLQTLIIHAKENVRIMAPCEIWEMPHLRHFLIKPLSCLPDPSSSNHQQDGLVLHNLQELLIVENLRLSEEVCKRIPNIKSLQLCYDGEEGSSSYYCLHNLCSFKQLKSLACEFSEMLRWRDSALNLPSSLRKLSLISRNLDWEDLSMIAKMVPHLEDLNFRFWDSSIGQFEGEFHCLKSLKIFCYGDFIEWNVEKSHFPVLHNLTLAGYRLDEIPPGIVDIPTLGKIGLFRCGASFAVSAVKVVMEQEELGEEVFELLLDFETAYDEDRFWELVEQQDLTSSNVVVNMSFRTHTTIRMKSRA